MAVPTVPKTDYYDKYSQNINNMYNTATAGIDKTQEADRKIAAQQYTGMRNQSSVNAAKNQMALKEQMAAQGLNRSGDNITGSVNINNQRSNDINTVNNEEQNYYAKLDQEKYKRVQDLEMQKQQALMNAMYRAEDNSYKDKQFDYQVGRDEISDGRYDKEWQYQTDRDKVSDDRYNKEWDYNTGRDKINDDRYNKEWDYNTNKDQKEWDYNTGRDKVNDDRWLDEWNYKKEQDKLSQSNWERNFTQAASRSSSRGSSSGYGSGSSKDNAWSVFADTMGSDARAGNKFLRENKEDLIEAIGSTEYNKMQSKADDVWNQNVTNERKKRQGSRGY